MSYHEDYSSMKHNNLNKDTSRHNLSALEKSPPSRFSTIHDNHTENNIEYQHI